ncbi:hypothetical protein [Flavobacterium sp. 123]|uniref:hypothetical protein n=1 Tax=Flavobacterium sp. 123 TaxID=2135627 RepID=UPI000EAE39C3|nr:hypothetical protein [Flavobacterium sp. 123]RKT00386.1 hypothetical protein C8C88_2213 [Flavobacterium sp. 123]RKT00388.1 hypothetical protein C8C88_2215 [Flavobacterium sp. 123]
MHKIFEIITEIVGWIQIVLSPTLLGIGFSLGIYYYFPNQNGMILGITISVIGFIIGLIWATKKFKTTGTIHFLSRIIATPELDNLEKTENGKTESGKNKNSH